MAAGSRKGTLQAVNASIPATFSATGSVSVAINDLIVCLVVEQTNLTVTGVTDNLGHTYTAQNAGTDAGNVTGRFFYKIATAAGTLTSVDAACTSGIQDAAIGAVVYEGTVTASDANPANTSNDTTSPFTCPSTGTLAQASELVIAWMATQTSSVYSATSPNLKDLEVIQSTTAHVVIGSQVVAATTAVVPEFTAGSSPTNDVLGTMSFKLSSNKTLAAGVGSYTLTGTAATIVHGHPLSAGSGSYSLTGTAASLVHGHPIVAATGSYTLTGTAAGVKHAWKPVAGVGSYSLTGTSASLVHASKVAAGVGSYSLTGTSASLLHAWKASAGIGSYALTGASAALVHAALLAADAGAYALTGSVASVLHAHNVVAGTATYDLTGSDADLVTGAVTTWSLSAPAGSYSLTGAAAEIIAATAETGTSCSLLTEAGDTLVTEGGDGLILEECEDEVAPAVTIGGARKYGKRVDVLAPTELRPPTELIEVARVIVAAVEVGTESGAGEPHAGASVAGASTIEASIEHTPPLHIRAGARISATAVDTSRALVTVGKVRAVDNFARDNSFLLDLAA